MRAIHYQVKGHPRSTLLTSLTDPKLYPGPRNWSSCTTSAGRPRSPTTRSRRTCSRGRRRFAVARPTVSGKSCGASLSPTTWCALKSNVQPQRRTCPRPESASSPPSPSCGNEIAWLYGRRLGGPGYHPLSAPASPQEPQTARPASTTRTHLPEGREGEDEQLSPKAPHAEAP